MVRIFLTLFFLLRCCLWGLEDVSVTPDLSAYTISENQPIKGTITIQHNLNVPVDVSTFRIGGKILKVDFIKDVRISPNSPLILSIYNFELPPTTKGLHFLPEIQVNIGGKFYKSYAISYQVSGASDTPAAAPAQTANPQAPNAPQAAAQNPSPAELRIEALAVGPTTLYPGQRTKLVYRYYYTGDIELSKEVLPLLDAEGLKKVGDKQNKDFTEGNLSVSEFSQEVEAVKPGTFSYGPSIAEGHSYQQDSTGRRIYGQKLLHTEAPPVVITVKPLPTQEKPASFNGAIGQYIFGATLASTPEVTVGDKIQLNLTITGDPNTVSTVPAPDLCCQPGFSGMFRPSDLPPVSTVQGPTKTFTVELRPLSTAIKEVPSIEFSSFDPATGKYIISHTDPLPLTVLGEKNAAPIPQAKTTAPPSAPSNAIVKPGAIEISGIYDLTPSDLSGNFGGNWWVLLWIPVALVLLYVEENARQQQLLSEKQGKTKSAQTLYDEAMKQEIGSPEFYNRFKQAFMQKLVECGEIKTNSIEPESLPPRGAAGEVKTLLAKLDENRFAGKDKFDMTLLYDAQQLFERLDLHNKQY